MKPLRQFMIDNADKYGIVPYWSDQKLSIENPFTHEKKFGSYKFEAGRWHDYFELENARNHFRFYVDMKNKKFICVEYSSYKIHKYLGVNEYNHQTRTSSYMPITNYGKFAEWFWQIVDDFNNQEEN